MQTVSTALNAVTQQNKELVQLVERQSTNNKQETKPLTKPTWQQPQQQQNWQAQQQNWQPQQQNWRTQQQWQKIIHSNKRNPKPRNNHNNRHNNNNNLGKDPHAIIVEK